MAGEALRAATWTWYFAMVDSADFATLEPGKTVSIQHSKDGAAFAGADTANEISDGAYYYAFSPADMDANAIVAKAEAAGCATQLEIVYTVDKLVNGGTIDVLNDKLGYSLAADQSGVTFGTVNVSVAGTSTCVNLSEIMSQTVSGGSKNGSDLASYLDMIKKSAWNQRETNAGGEETLYDDDDSTPYATTTYGTTGGYPHTVTDDVAARRKRYL